jgi:hypothetical protein
MAVGLKYGANEINQEKKALSYAKAQTLFQQFEKQHGSVMCRNLIKYDLSNPEELAKAKQANVFETVCSKFIKSVIKNFVELENP